MRTGRETARHGVHNATTITQPTWLVWSCSGTRRRSAVGIRVRARFWCTRRGSIRHCRWGGGQFRGDPLGLLFGLGFDTASEVALLGISATSVGKGMPIIVVMLFPLLFAAGMSLVDTMDSILILGAYGWAFVKPMRKLYCNMNITLISVLVALVVGTCEVLEVLAGKFALEGGVWDWIAHLDFERIGYLIIGIFLVTWLGSTLIYKAKDYDAIEVVETA